MMFQNGIRSALLKKPSWLQTNLLLVSIQPHPPFPSFLFLHYQIIIIFYPSNLPINTPLVVLINPITSLS